jgi:Flp pilus assembly protein TadG
MGQHKPQHKSFMRSLLHDPTANTIVIAAAALVPLMAMVGGGVDASRYYMAASRLQAACDAGALAARRAMTNDTFTNAHNQIALNFFDHNFNDGLYGSTGRARSYTSNGSGVVTGTASAVMPSTIMRAFGFTNFNISVTCSADINISNTDIMFVLDVTGSMNCPDNNISGCSNNGNVEASNSLIVGLRNATMNFYDTVKSATSSSAQVRFGAVPYAHSVNVGASLPSTYIASSHTYQSRLYRNELVYERVEWVPRLTSNFGSTNTDNYRFGNGTDWWGNATVNTSERDRCQNTLRSTFRVGNELFEATGNTYVLNAFNGGSSTNRAGCSATVRRTFAAYEYRPLTYDVGALRTGGSVTLPTGTNGANVTHSWDGCIEEADTVDSATWSPVPTNAFDLDINLKPTTEAQRWKPTLPLGVYRRVNSSNARDVNVVTTPNEMNRSLEYVCVAPAFKLRDISRTELQTYVNNLRARGATYHDIGMIWGARFISPKGIFDIENQNAPNGDPIARHIVFMTDGFLSPNLDVYSPYGMEWWDRRVTSNNPPTAAQAAERHEARFQAACRAARNENISVWVVAFGTELTDSLRNCASPGRAYQASNNAELNTAFQEIAQKIAALRLTK